MTKRVAALLVLLGIVAGCASEREHNLQRYDAMHENIRTAPPDAPQKWEMNPDSK